MKNIYCTKCGVRGTSKCPNCRSIFGSRPTNEKQVAAQEYFEMFMSIGLKNKDDRAKIAEGNEAQHLVSFWHYAHDGQEAATSILSSLQHYLPLANLEVAACLHDWQLLPGETSSIGCGCEGPAVGTPVPPDPYAA